MCIRDSVQVVDPFLNVGGIFLLYQGADFLVLRGQGVIGLHSELGALFLTRQIGLRPVDDGDRIIRLGIVGIGLGGLLVIVLGQVEFLHLQIKVSDALDAVDVLGLDLQDLLVLVNRLLGIVVVLRRVSSRNVLLSIGSGQIEAAVDERRVQRDGLLEMVNRCLLYTSRCV